MERKYIFFDIDGTLLDDNPGGKILESTYRTLDKLKENKKKDTLTDSMMMFLILNTASIQIIPTTVIAIRNSMGSSNPTAIVFPVWIATIVAAIFRNYCNKSIN